MQALLFEMKPREGHEDHYFQHAANLRPLLAQQEGLLFIERFKSLSRPGFILSHSLWRDEASIAKWRTDAQHHKSQTAGRYKHFEDYRIRISHVLQFTGADEPVQEWTKEGAYNDVGRAAERFLVVARTNAPTSERPGETFKSVTEEGSYLTISEAADEEQGRSWITDARSDDSVVSALLGRVSRDYGMYERAEAPQYFKPVDET